MNFPEKVLANKIYPNRVSDESSSQNVRYQADQESISDSSEKAEKKGRMQLN